MSQVTSTLQEKIKLTNKEYVFVCELIWGGAPVDIEWGEQTSIFKENAPKILEKYPMLDKSFFDNYTKKLSGKNEKEKR